MSDSQRETTLEVSPPSPLYPWVMVPAVMSVFFLLALGILYAVGSPTTFSSAVEISSAISVFGSLYFVREYNKSTKRPAVVEARGGRHRR